jgi:hypothetical protein
VSRQQIRRAFCQIARRLHALFVLAVVFVH